jgi:beta-glucanase (GH16 family)
MVLATMLARRRSRSPGLGSLLQAAIVLGAIGCGGAHTPASTVRSAEPGEFKRGSHSFRLHARDTFDQGLGDAELGAFTFQGNLAGFSPDNVRLEAGLLKLFLTDQPSGSGVRARAFTGSEYQRNDEQLYGRFVTRMQPHSTAGVITSFFTAFYDFDADWNIRETAELDIEFVGTTRAVELAIHWIDPQGEAQKASRKVTLPFDAADDFHAWEIEWLPERVAFYVDGKELQRFDDSRQMAELAHPQRVMANLWITDAADWAGAFDPRRLPLHVAYDYIETYTLEQ